MRAAGTALAFHVSVRPSTTKKLFAFVIPAGVALGAFLCAHGVSALLAAALTGEPPVTALPVAHAAVRPEPKAADAGAILRRNPFDHATALVAGPTTLGDEGRAERSIDPRDAPPCADVRAMIVVGADDPDASFAAFDVGGKRVLRRRGGEVEGKRVVYVGRDRAWLEDGSGALCQAAVFGGQAPVAVAAAAPPPAASEDPLAKSLAGKITRVSPTELHVDRSAVDVLLEAQAEMMKLRVIPVKEGDRVLGVTLSGIKPGSAMALLGFANGDRLDALNGIEVSSPEKMLQIYAMMKSGSMSRLTAQVVRGGKPTNLDFVVK